MFELPTHPSSIVLEITIVRDIILMTQDDDDTNQEILKKKGQDPGDSTLSSNIENDNLDNQQDVLHRDQARRDKTR
jgi:hypothetical protein